MSKKNEYEQSFALNSAFKTNYNDSTSSFTYVFPEKLTNVIDIRISHLEIPVDAYFAVSEYYGNNKFTIRKTLRGDPNAVTEYVVIIPDNNYISMDDYRDIINLRINDVLGSAHDITALHNQYTMFFHVAENSLFDYTIDFAESIYNPTIERNLGYILGFRKSTYDIVAGGFIEGERPVNLSPTKAFFIVLEDFTNNFKENIKVGFANHFLNKHVLARIPFTRTKDEARSFIFNKFSDTPGNVRKYSGPTDIQKIKIEILDDYGEVINLLGADWGFVITATMLFNKNE
tara:strand:- start:361 stop:1224 length:864 start_codon:yes stop_codon:yes gene_type:complete